MSQNWYDINGISRAFLRNTIAFFMGALIAAVVFLWLRLEQCQNRTAEKLEIVYQKYVEYAREFGEEKAIRLELEKELDRLKIELKKCKRK